MSAADLDRIADELYSLPPAGFTAARDAEVAEARRAGDTALATAVAALRRPVAAAWAVNLLAHHRPDELRRIAELGAALRDAQDRLHGEELRRLSRRRQDLVAGLARTAGALARAAGHEISDAALDEVEATLDAALADPAAAEQVEAGHLAKPLPRPATAPGRPAAGVAPSAPRGVNRQRGSGSGTTGARVPDDATVTARVAAVEAAQAHDRAREARRHAEEEFERVSREAADVERRLRDLRTRRNEAAKRLTRTRREEDVTRRALAKTKDSVEQRR